MTWSQWFVTPALTSVFFLLGVLTFYWFISSKLIKHLEKRHKDVNPTRIQTIVGVIYIMLLIIVTQLSVEGTTNGWVFVNFQVFAVIFVSYFLELNLRPWQLGILILAYMSINNTLTIGLSWLFALTYFGLYFAMTFIKKHRHASQWRNFCDYTLVNLVFAVAMWADIKFRFELTYAAVAWEVLFSFFFMTITFVYINSVLDGANTLAHLTYTTNFDELTRVHNYYAFKNEFGQAFEYAQTQQIPLTIMLFDIDHFKHVNDTYGHLAGDYVLSNVARLITKQLKTIDPTLTLYRTGGEEFTIIFKNYTTTQAADHAKAIAQMIHDQAFHYAGQDIDISISAGVTALQTIDENQLDLYRRADQNLYYSKRHGRDQITID
ncbi:GGDEF domain-containing protein [Levilactobacillus tujiorum]|uniref:GGDEF domain-containing protein n=1 Tax=Levilactobacillus tujiorum TaxID=2912243 RepID=UPI0014572429|nr:GGDEF domain-containing protein [Levilactobacillus tujiorum]NLR31416.1 GGDEF domain-containing protein [Levilactobacillus tujiorum]